VPLSRLHVPDLAAEAVSRGIVADISGTTVWRWLSDDAIRPWARRSWIFPRGPDFKAKAGRVLDLYARTWDNRPLGKRDFVISSDEKTSIQARVRCHPTLAPAPGRTMRVEHEYDRGGALAYLAAWDVHRAKIMGRCEPTMGIEPFRRLVAPVMTTEPYASGPEGVLDRRQRQLPSRQRRRRPSPQRLAQRHPRVAAGARQLAQPDRDLLLGHRGIVKTCGSGSPLITRRLPDLAVRARR
jgi:hypothetical protein